MEFVETKIFTEDITKLLSDEEYKALQILLLKNPKSGDVIRETGGIRKCRCAAKGHGKRGGIRIIYYYYVTDDIIYMLLAYPKNKKDDLSKTEKKYLKHLVEGFKNG